MVYRLYDYLNARPVLVGNLTDMEVKFKELTGSDRDFDHLKRVRVTSHVWSVIETVGKEIRDEISGLIGHEWLYEIHARTKTAELDKEE